MDSKIASFAGVELHPLKRIEHPLGDIFHGVKKSDRGFEGFGEAYFSSVANGAIKGWKLHKRMTLNLVVPLGAVRFVVFDDRENSPTRNKFYDVTLGPSNYQRLTIAPGLWLAFAGASSGLNLLLNIASIEHDPEESLKRDVSEIPYDWKL
jgi:dTDP-4-dehydrorhamnose 3,5-epimerase